MSDNRTSDAGTTPSTGATPETVTSPAPAVQPVSADSGSTSSSQPREASPEPSRPVPTGGKDPLRSSRASGLWGAVVALVVLLVLLAIFILQNTREVTISFLGWEGEAPLAAALLIATAIGLAIAVSAGTLRLLQLRHRVRRAQKR